MAQIRYPIGAILRLFICPRQMTTNTFAKHFLISFNQWIQSFFLSKILALPEILLAYHLGEITAVAFIVLENPRVMDFPSETWDICASGSF